MHTTSDLNYIQAFLVSVGHCRRFIKGFEHMAQPLHEYLSGDWAGKKSKLVTLTQEAFHTFGVLKEP